jgi:hypothetical protein
MIEQETGVVSKPTLRIPANLKYLAWFVKPEAEHAISVPLHGPHGTQEMFHLRP